MRFNELLHDFAARAYGRPARAGAVARGASRGRRRALYVSSPIGLGHAWRDVAIARELRALHPDLRSTGSRRIRSRACSRRAASAIHPASAALANESRHIAAESREHELNVFQAWRRMDEILLANFMVFRDVGAREPYDLWIGDEAWELDYYLHENPELKTAPYAFLTDFVGWLPMPEGGDAEARLTADYNAEMIEQIARFPRVRDRAIFVGDARGRRAARLRRRPARRSARGSRSTSTSAATSSPPTRARRSTARRCAPSSATARRGVCIVTVGGSGVGAGLLRRVIDAYPQARERVPGLRMVVVCGPRIDPDSLPRTTAWSSSPTSTASRATSRPATSPSPRAA